MVYKWWWNRLESNRTIPCTLWNGYDNISVYDGGWYEWLMHDDYPVQVGDPASDECVHTTVGELPTGKAAK